jgi:3-phytase
MSAKIPMATHCRARSWSIGALAATFLGGCQLGAVEIPACVQSDVVRSKGDAADDAAIWVNPADAAASVVIGTDKKAGLHVYDLGGRELQFLPLGETNNVDLKADFPFRQGPAPILATTNRATGSIMLLRFDPSSRRIQPEPIAEIPHGPKSYGVCLHRAPDGAVNVGATVDGGPFSQWRLEVTSSGEIVSTLIRTLEFASPAEGCVFDDQLGRLYVGEEDKGIWRFPADPARGDAGILIDEVNALRGFPADVEGVDIYALDGGDGYLIVSNQGNSTFRVYERGGDNAYVGRFRVTGCADGSADAVTDTDGLATVSDSLGAAWPAGLLVVQDHRDKGRDGRQNFRYVSWADVAGKMKLAPGENATKSSGR